MYPTKADASRASTWLSEGWKVFKSNPGAWIVMTILLFIASVLLNLIPLMGSLTMMLLTPALLGGCYFIVNTVSFSSRNDQMLTPKSWMTVQTAHDMAKLPATRTGAKFAFCSRQGITQWRWIQRAS